MKTKTLFCALALLASLAAVQASAEARNYDAHSTTVLQLANNAEVIVAGKLKSVENVSLSEPGQDAATYKSIGDGSIQDGEAYVRRDGILQVNTVLKGNVSAGQDLRFVSIRQLKFDAYDKDLREGEAVYFLHTRPTDGRYYVMTDERGTVSGPESQGDLNKAIDFVKYDLANPDASAEKVERMLDTITLDGSRLSVDCATELSWQADDTYKSVISQAQRDRLLDLCKASAVGSEERNQLLTAVGRMPATGALEGLLNIMFEDSSWSTTSLGAMSLEYVDRHLAINRLLDSYDAATDDTRRMVIVRALGLIRPKLDYDGEQARSRTLEMVRGLLKAETDKNLLREALIASRDLRSQDAHIEELKALIDNRATNGLTLTEVKAAITALAAARTTDQDGKVTILAKDYLVALGEADVELKQYVNSALKFPYTTLITGADGKGH